MKILVTGGAGLIGSAVIRHILACTHYENLDTEKRKKFRFHHISTDEVYGDLHGTDDLFTETTSSAPVLLMQQARRAPII